MNDELLLLTDENSILISVEFIDKSEETKIGDSSKRTYEIDLIVSKDITCAQLLEAIGAGLAKRIIDIEGVSGIQAAADLHILYQDVRDPNFSEVTDLSAYADNDEAFSTNNDSQAQANGETDVGEKDEKYSKTNNSTADETLKSKKYRNEKTNTKAETDEIVAPKSIRVWIQKILSVFGFLNLRPKSSQQDKNIDTCNTLAEPELVVHSEEAKIYARCLKIFETCIRAYNNEDPGYSTWDDIKKNNCRGVKDKPVIMVGSINYSALPEGVLEYNSSTHYLKLYKGFYNGKTLREVGMISTSYIRFSANGSGESAPLFDKTKIKKVFRKTAPEYTIYDAPLWVLDDEKVHIIPPSDPPTKSQTSIIASLLSPIIMGVVMLFSRTLTTGFDKSMLLMSASMIIASPIIAITNWLIQKYQYDKKVQEWKYNYENYINKLTAKIRNRQRRDTDKLCNMYPSKEVLVNSISKLSGNIYSRRKDHPDYMCARIGLSGPESELTPSVFKIEGEKKEVVFTSARYHYLKKQNAKNNDIAIDIDGLNQNNPYLIDLPNDIANQYAYLYGAPVLLNFKTCGTLGLISDYDSAQNFLTNVLLDLCYYHSPDELQIIVLNRHSDDWISKQSRVEFFKYLPHFRELLGDISSFAFDKAGANLIFNKLLEILSNRKKANSASDTDYPHILLIVFEEYDLKRHLISEYLPSNEEDAEKNSLGISYIFCKNDYEELPKFCGKVIRKTINEKNDKKAEWFLFPHTYFISYDDDSSGNSDDWQKKPPSAQRYCFLPDTEISEKGNKLQAFRFLSALTYERIVHGVGVPTKLELFSLMNTMDNSSGEGDIAERIHSMIQKAWGIDSNQSSSILAERNDTTKSLRVPIGLKEDNNITYLDLHESADGPHMLVAGTTGSGKTETILTYLIMLCYQYTPEEVNLLLMDMKGAGFIKSLGDLPHIVGTVSDISGDETGTGMAYMLKRFLDSMNSEVKERKKLLSAVGAKSVDDYTKIRTKLKKRLKDNPKSKELEVQLEAMPPLPHLFLVVDEFTELMRFNNENESVDFRGAITSLARIGRSLGFHIILISQNIESAITPDIEVNTRARLCLKVATREASRSMIGTDVAASPLMPGNGRAYLLIGTGSRFDYFQTAYSGAYVQHDNADPYVVTNACLSGRYYPFYNDSIRADLEKLIQNETQDSPSESTEDEKHKNLNIDALKINNSSETATTINNRKTAENNGDEEKTDKYTQLDFIAKNIKECNDEAIKNGQLKERRVVFKQPLPKSCYYEYNWDDRTGSCKVIEGSSSR